ncbi:MAG: cyclic nucleotide-binding domain-containing protein [Halobacteriovoraceae bacterium]|jgi:CRP/FNR family transcriptional regulator, cyclic AMP receptor protein|nr:cyclic nucleotide-binding domain-containing protein [Halobacteriovoraceae bacterium]MBT5094591.1 cyclic nucleotide-binding domain-containing protein [Halobacteriovoraceae bacterium]
MSESLEVKAEEFLVREGEESAQMYFLQEGTMAVFKIKGDREQQVGTIYAGELVGEMSFLDKQPRSASVKAVSDCKLTVIPHDKFEKFLDKQPSWYRALINTLLDRLRRANARIKV